MNDYAVSHQEHPSKFELGAFQQPPDCPRTFCSAIEWGQKELARLNLTQAQLREALAREEVLLNQKDELIRHQELMSRESDHRLMNGLQMVSSLLSLQSREVQSTEAAEHLQIAAHRVATIGSLHRRLHALDHIGTVELKQYLANLCHDLKGVLPGDNNAHTLAVEGIPLEAPTAIGIPLGYITSELVMNAAKHANGKILVRLGMNPDRGYQLSISDEGPGLPEGFDPKKSRGLGMKIVSSLVERIGGQLLFGRNDSGQGSRFAVRFTLDEHPTQPRESNPHAA